jgi:hypothetical protein
VQRRVTTSITPPVPRAAERLLEALGADAEFRDALLGDMAEEYALRAAYDGTREANRWYRREALRVAPHLLRDGLRRLRWRGAARLTAVVLGAYLVVVTIGVLVNVLLVRVLYGPRVQWGMWLALGMPLSLRITLPMLGGYLAARLDRRAPLVAATALGAACVFVPLAVQLAGPSRDWPAWFLWLQLGWGVVVLGAAWLGGALRVATRGGRARSLP